jgi:hypothetical protein
MRFVVVFVLLCGMFAFLPNHLPIETYTSPSDSSSNAVPTPYVPHTVAEWSGSGIKNTETFHITSDTWYVGWATKPGQYGNMNFQICIYNADGSLKGIAANVIGASNDQTVMRGSGDYYLEINSGQPYDVVVQE